MPHNFIFVLYSGESLPSLSFPSPLNLFPLLSIFSLSSLYFPSSLNFFPLLSIFSLPSQPFPSPLNLFPLFSIFCLSYEKLWVWTISQIFEIVRDSQSNFVNCKRDHLAGDYRSILIFFWLYIFIKKKIFLQLSEWENLLLGC